MAKKASYMRDFLSEEIPEEPKAQKPQAEDGDFIVIPARKTERIQLLTTKKRRDWLKAEAKKKKISVNELINELILKGMSEAGNNAR